LLSRDKHVSPARLRQLLAASSHPVSSTGSNTRGVNACAALSALLQAPACAAPVLNSVMR
jgi:hypothetical protein